MKLALGTVQFGLPYGIANTAGQMPLSEASAIVRTAEAHGVRTLDTAVAYGTSEATLGQIGVAGWDVVSKLPAIPTACPDITAWVATSVEASLARLQVPRLYGLLLHQPGQLLTDAGPELHAALLSLKAAGKVTKIGVSIYDPVELDLLCRQFAFDLVQAPFNLLDRRLAATGWLSRLRDQGTELHVRSVFLQGLLLMSRGTRPAAFARWAELWAAFDQWLVESRLTPVQACLRHVLAVPEISKVVVGVDSEIQLREILQAADGPPALLPESIGTTDADLLNPSRWASIN